MSNYFKDAEKDIDIPDSLTFKDAFKTKHIISKENIRLEPVYADYPFEEEIIAINITAETDEGTVTSNITFSNEHGNYETMKVESSIGTYGEDPDLSYDDRSFDTPMNLTKKTIKNIKVNIK